MKKIIMSLVLLVSMACATPASAFGFDWGVTGGLNMTKLKLKGDYMQNFNTNNRAGWYAGLKGNLSLALGFGLDASLVYSQQKYSLDGENITSKTMRSVAIPINVRYNIGLGSVASVFLATGPQFDFNVGSRSWNIASEDYTGTAGMFKQENMTTSWNIGAGVKVLDRVEVGVGYNFALGKVAKSVFGNATGIDIRTNEMKANTFKLSATVYF